MSGFQFQPNPWIEFHECFTGDCPSDGHDCVKSLRVDCHEREAELLARIDTLEKALGDWLTWEDEQIRKEGEYCGKRINELITQCRVALRPSTGGGTNE